jgi:hypothetical protein
MVVVFTTTCAINEFEPRSWRGVLVTTLCDAVCQWLATGRWFSLGTPVSSTNKTGRHDITEILLKVVLNTINQTKPSINNSWPSLPVNEWLLFNAKWAIFQLYHGENKLQFFSYIMARTSYKFSAISWREQVTIFQLYHGENKLQFFSYIMARTSYNFSAISWREQVTFFSSPGL